VTIASQIKYIRYYEKILKELHCVVPPAHKIILTRLLVPIPAKINGQPFAWIEINNIVTHRTPEVILGKKQKGYEIIVEGMCEGDCKIQLLHKQGRKFTKVCHFWFNTGFIDCQGDNKLNKPMIDVANKDKKAKIFKHEFCIIPVFRPYDPKTEKEPEEKFNNWMRYSLAKEKKKQTMTTDDDGNDTEDSSVELKEEEDGDAAFLKKLEVPTPPPQKIQTNGVKHSNSEEEQGGRNQSRSIYKTDGYNLDFDLTESDEESVDCTEDELGGSAGVPLTIAPSPKRNKGPSDKITHSKGKKKK